MAFRRKKTFRSFRRRKIPSSAIPKSIARVRRQKVVAFNTMQACEHTCVIEDGASCVSSLTVAILRNSELQELFGDNCKVASVRGSVWIDPWFKPPYSIAQQEYGETSEWLVYMDLMSRTILQGRAGLIKTFSNSETPDNPLPDYVIADSFDWSEAPWIRQWNHLWFPKETYELEHPLEGAFLAMCSNTSSAGGGLALNPLAGGTGNINTAIAPTVTSCDQVFRSSDEGFPQRAKRVAHPVKPWRIPLNIRKDITLRENQNLELKVSFSSLFPGGDCFPFEEDPCELTAHAFPCLFRIIPNIMLTIQYG